MQEPFPAPTWGGGQFDFFMDLFVLVATLVTPEKSQDLILFPRPVFDLLSQQKVTPANPVAVKLGFLEDLIDFGYEFRGGPFICIQNQHPFMAGLRNGPI